MQQSNKKRICRNCGKPLQIEKCPNCWGTGEVSHFFFWEKECPACKGTGTRFRCPDHLFSNLDLKYSNVPKIQSGQLFCQKCFGSGWITNPITSKKEPCPVCRKIRYPQNIQFTDSPPPTPYRDSDGDGIQNHMDHDPFNPWYK